MNFFPSSVVSEMNLSKYSSATSSLLEGCSVYVVVVVVVVVESSSDVDDSPSIYCWMSSRVGLNTLYKLSVLSVLLKDCIVLIVYDFIQNQMNEKR